MRIILVLLAALSLTAGDSKPVAKKDLPVPVLAAFQKAYPSAKLKACSSELRDGKTCYELESKEGKTQRDLIYAADGSVLEIEESLAIADLPEAVEKAVADQYPKAVANKAEKLTKGNEVSYEVVVKDGKKKMELIFDVEGKVKAKAKN